MWERRASRPRVWVLPLDTHGDLCFCAGRGSVLPTVYNHQTPVCSVSFLCAYSVCKQSDCTCKAQASVVWLQDRAVAEKKCIFSLSSVLQFSGPSYAWMCTVTGGMHLKMGILFCLQVILAAIHWSVRDCRVCFCVAGISQWSVNLHKNRAGFLILSLYCEPRWNKHSVPRCTWAVMLFLCSPHPQIFPFY